jgi:hypothetical protein
MNHLLKTGFYVLLLAFFSMKSTFSFAQNKVCFFKYAAFPDKTLGGRLSFAPPGKKVYITKMDYSNPDQIMFVYGYGSKTERTEIYKKVTNRLFDREPKEIRGHKLLGAYFNSNISLYELYYLSPKRASMLVKEFAQPGRLFFYSYFSGSRTNPFEDMVLPFSLNDTIQLKPSPPAKKLTGK